VPRGKSSHHYGKRKRSTPEYTGPYIRREPSGSYGRYLSRSPSSRRLNQLQYRRRNKEELSKVDEEQLDYGEKNILNDEIEFAVAMMLVDPPGLIPYLKEELAKGNTAEYWRKLRNQNYSAKWMDQDPFNYTNRKINFQGTKEGLRIWVKGGPSKTISWEDISKNYVDVVFPADYYENISQNIASGMGEARVKILDDRTAAIISDTEEFDTIAGGFDKATKLRLTPKGQPTVADILQPGDIIESMFGDTKTERKANRSVYKVMQVSHHNEYGGIPSWSLVVIDPKTKPFKNGRYKENDYSYINELVAQDGKIHGLFYANGEEVNILKKGKPAAPVMKKSEEPVKAIPRALPSPPKVDKDLEEIKKFNEDHQDSLDHYFR